jgi:prepilin-type N-terminal cleavage/methylation domain-containing protein
MRRDGFSLIELVVTIAIAGTLLAIGGLIYSSTTRKSSIESQVKTMYSDLTDARSQAFYRKTCRYVTIAGTQFSVYTSSVCGSTAPTSGAIVNRTFSYAVTSNNTDSLCFDQRGVASLTSSDITAVHGKAICMTPNQPDILNSIVVSATGIQMGRLNAGGACDSANIAIQ